MLISATSFGAEKINTITGYLQLLCAFTLGMGLMREGLLDAEKPRARRGQSHALRNFQDTACVSVSREDATAGFRRLP
jgi:hypothetical protein